MIRDLDFDVEVVVCPTVRESDGLAMSSRNARLTGTDRSRALALRHGLNSAAGAIDRGERNVERVRMAGVQTMRDDGVEPEYFAIVDSGSLAPLSHLHGEVLIAVAARVGPVRLIDNDVVHVS